MSETPDNLVLALLRRLDERSARIEDRLATIERRLALRDQGGRFRMEVFDRRVVLLLSVTV